MKNLKKILFCLFVITGNMYTPYIACISPQQPMPKLLQMSPDEAEKMLEEINQWVASQPPEFQEAFKAEVSKQQEIIGSMKSEDEFLQYVNDIERQMTGEVAEQIAPSAPAPAELAPTPVPVNASEEKEAELPQQPVLKAHTAESARELLDEIVQTIDQLIERARTVQNMPFRIKTWGTQGKIKSWKTEKGAYDWVSIQHSINNFKARLHKIKDARYLAHLVEDKDLYSKLENLRDALSEQEPIFVVEKRDLRAPHISASASQAFRTILDTLNDNIFVFNLVKSIDALEEKYKPRADKLKEEEEKKAKLALETNKRTYQATPTVYAGAAPHEVYNPSTYSSPSYGGGYGGGYIPSAPSYPSYASAPSTDLGAPGAGGKAGGGAGKPGETGTKTEEEKKAEEKDKDKKKSEVSEKDFASTISDIEKELNDANDELAPTGNMAHINGYLHGAEPVDKKLVKKISRATSKMRMATRKAKKIAKDLNKKKADRKIRTDLGEEVRNLYNEHNNIKNMAHHLDQINDVHPNKRVAFGGGKPEEVKKAAAATTAGATPPVEDFSEMSTSDVFELRNEIRNFIRATQEINGF